MVWLHHKKAVHLHHKGVHIRGCTCLKCTNQAESAPTKQRIAPTDLLVQLRQLHPLKCTNQAKNSTNRSVGAAETAAPPKVHQPSKKCTNSSVGAAGTAAPPKVHQPSRERPNNNK